jgi:hypothetical protein
VELRKVPARQPIQPDAPLSVWYCPEAQLTQAFVVDPVDGKYLPAAQLSHTDAPTAVLNWPATQSTHTDEPNRDAYLPRAHDAHKLAFDPVDAKYVPGPHGRQAVWPVPVWYCPAAQLAHEFKLDPVDARYVPATQLEQAVELPAVWNCPAAQSRHEEDPLLAAYFPAAQLAQALADDPVRLK